jgi:hypothetical protein
MPVIPTTWEAQVGGLAPRPTLRPYLKNNLKEKRKKKKRLEMWLKWHLPSKQTQGPAFKT